MHTQPLPNQCICVQPPKFTTIILYNPYMYKEKQLWLKFILQYKSYAFTSHNILCLFILCNRVTFSYFSSVILFHLVHFLYSNLFLFFDVFNFLPNILILFQFHFHCLLLSLATFTNNTQERWAKYLSFPSTQSRLIILQHRHITYKRMLNYKLA